MMTHTITVCGGGALGHVIAGWLSAKRKATVNILTNHPESWTPEIEIDTPDGQLLHGSIHHISGDPSELIPSSDIVLLCLPGFLIAEELRRIKPFLRESAYVGSVFSSTGFFFEALRVLRKGQPLWGFQRVPFIARVAEYGKSAHLLGYKGGLNIAVEHVGNREKQDFARLVQGWMECPVHLLGNYYEASLTNSNPLLHPSRLYTLFGGENEGRVYPRMVYFYEEWTEEAAGLLIKMDAEFFALLNVLPVSADYLPTILDYYESHDARSLAAKLSSIQGFKGIMSPMKRAASGWVPDYESRYFTEDFPYGLKFIWQLAHEKGVECPNIDKVYEWGISKITAEHGTHQDF